MLADAKERKFNIILVWSLDRFSREGIVNTLHYLEKLACNGVALKSLQESWLDTGNYRHGQIVNRDHGVVAQQERQRISERTKAGLHRAKASGKQLGRHKGSKDKARRKTSGYNLRWQNKKD